MIAAGLAPCRRCLRFLGFCVELLAWPVGLLAHTARPPNTMPYLTLCVSLCCGVVVQAALGKEGAIDKDKAHELLSSGRGSLEAAAERSQGRR